MQHQTYGYLPNQTASPLPLGREFLIDFISHPADGKRLSWPKWLVTYQVCIPANGHVSVINELGVADVPNSLTTSTRTNRHPSFQGWNFRLTTSLRTINSDILSVRVEVTKRKSDGYATVTEDRMEQT